VLQKSEKYFFSLVQSSKDIEGLDFMRSREQKKKLWRRI